MGYAPASGEAQSAIKRLDRPRGGLTREAAIYFGSLRDRRAGRLSARWASGRSAARWWGTARLRARMISSFRSNRSGVCWTYTRTLGHPGRPLFAVLRRGAEYGPALARRRGEVDPRDAVRPEASSSSARGCHLSGACGADRGVGEEGRLGRVSFDLICAVTISDQFGREAARFYEPAHERSVAPRRSKGRLKRKSSGTVSALDLLAQAGHEVSCRSDDSRLGEAGFSVVRSWCRASSHPGSNLPYLGAAPAAAKPRRLVGGTALGILWRRSTAVPHPFT